MKNYLAIDLGAESGRAVLGLVDDGKLSLREIYRFKNEMVFKNGHLRWDITNIFKEIKNALKIIVKEKIKLSGIGIDTWGVDFGFIDENGKLIEDPITYRDSRTDGIMEKVFKVVSPEEIYRKTGIQFLPFNTLYQLIASADENRDIGNCKLLFIPDILNYLLTGKLQTESTIASTSQLLSADGTWASEIFSKLNLPINIMPVIKQSGSVVGELNIIDDELVSLNGTSVFSVGSHDTASAVTAVPAGNEPWAYLSSGTWSLMGTELMEPIINEQSLKQNFTNEKGVLNTYRFLKNISGFWLLQECKKVWEKEGQNFSYPELSELAKKEKPFVSLIKVNDSSFLHPRDMTKAIAEFCTKTNQSVPKTQGEFTRCILESLALEYKNTLGQIEKLAGKTMSVLFIVGGGSQNILLNQFTANATGKTVIAGPAEATSVGNILVQSVADKKVSDIKQAREIVKKSFNLQPFLPANQNLWQEAFLRYNTLL